MPHFFISYAKKDTRELALALSDALNKVPSVTAWVDRSLKAGSSWELQIQTEIDRCDYFVVLYSPDINRHKQGDEPSYVLKEISYAVNTLKKPVIPVMAQRTQAPFSLNDVHYIDFTLTGISLNDLLVAICEEANISSESAVLTPKATRPHSRILDILPQPFDWCEIPVGKVTLGGNSEANGGYIRQMTSFDVKTFTIGKYPVTNAQFAKFIDAGGYRQKKWWTEAAWQQKEKDRWTEPRFWKDSNFNSLEQPVVGVSWYEASAFCQFLSEVSGDNIALPTEQQWQRAAQGDDQRVYPWGNNWEANRCNSNVEQASINKTSTVTLYAGKGDSAYQVVDMAGNIWEWCLTAYETGNTRLDGAIVRVLRGGSWHNYVTNYFRVDYRNLKTPNERNNSIGFRISASLN